MIWEISAFWLTMAAAVVCILSFMLSLGLNAVMGSDSFGPYGTMSIIVGGFFGSIYALNAYGIRVGDLTEAVMIGMVGSFGLLFLLLVGKSILKRI